MAASRRRPMREAGRFVAALALAALAAGCAASRPREEPANGTQGAPSPNGAQQAPAGAKHGRTPPRTGTGVPGGGPSAPPPVTDAWRTATSVRIGLRTGAPELLLSGSTAWRLVKPDSSEVASEKAGVPLRVARGAGGALEITRRGSPEPIARADGRDTLLLLPEERGFSGWSGRWYRGSFRIFASADSGLTLVNEVGLESYLRGVLPEEIGTPPETDFEAVKAQAVAARSYTLSFLGRRADLGFDLWATVEDQVYGGTLRENAQSNRAVLATRGELLLSDGAPIRALYSSACGGRTANVEDVWPWPWTPYLRSVRDADENEPTGYCSLSANYRWREEWGVDAFMEMLRKYAPPEGADASPLDGNLVDAAVTSRSRCGRVSEVVVTTTEGKCVLRGDRLRWSIRRPGTQAILRSSFIKIGVLRAADGAPLKVVVTGAGNGHGIGMCQWGAMGMARAGISYREILRHYYKATRFAHL